MTKMQSLVKQYKVVKYFQRCQTNQDVMIVLKCSIDALRCAIANALPIDMTPNNAFQKGKTLD